MGYVKISWSVPPEDQIIPFLKAMPEDLLAYMEEILQESTDEITQWMQQNAPWEDRTGAARASLWSDVETSAAHIVRLVMAYGPEIAYSRYLEDMQMGRFSILTPAMEHWFPILSERVVQALAGYRPRNRRLTAHRIAERYDE